MSQDRIYFVTSLTTTMTLFHLLIVLTLLPFVTPIPKQLGPFCTIDWSLTGGKVGEEEITFDLSCNVTTGWIGFGLTRNGAMLGADIVTVRLLQNGTNYLEDRHGVGNVKPVKDVHNDYKLVSSARTGNRTSIKFSRLLNTCDKEDLDISGDTIKLIWAVGPFQSGTPEKMEGHVPENRGVVTVNLLEKAVPVQKPKWGNPLRFEQNIVLNGNTTLYSCRIHKSPVNEKHHVIGYELYFGSPLSRTYAHHASLLSCTPPPGSAEDYFSQYKDHEFDCYYSDKYYPVEHCKFFEFQWAYGGTTTAFPEDLGVPLGEQKDQYFMTMIHINNPKKGKNIDFRVGFDLFYTKQLRKIDIGFLQLGINSSRAYSLTVPPNSPNYILSSHCPNECTKNLPPAGVQVFMSLLHFHLSGRKMKIRHFRDGVELPWITKDDNYDTDYQISRALSKPVTLMPHDHLTVECEFDTRGCNGSTVIGGRGIENEMCQAFLMYYPRVKDMNRCGSNIEQDKMLEFMGIERVQMEKHGNDPIVLGPANISGKRYTEVVSGSVKWTPQMRASFQNWTRFGTQIATCRIDNKLVNVITKYPSFKKEYAVVNKCGGGKGTGHSGAGSSKITPIMFTSVLQMLNIGLLVHLFWFKFV